MRSVFRKSTALAVLAVFLLVPVFAQQGQQSQQSQQSRTETQTQAGKTSGEKVNLNTARLDELQKLPRIGPKVAQRIIDFRKENGAFKRVEDLMKVKGIGEKLFLQIKNLIAV
ncbi:MAG: helix-hairpin-helix domain-containing protein [Candidatus Aminicenantes bacterium]|nr:helix-hairpin-helix domain-containing protein [Candidatus Aminicenantes bacterium]